MGSELAVKCATKGPPGGTGASTTEIDPEYMSGKNREW
jgi:hypothetical protein